MAVEGNRIRRRVTMGPGRRVIVTDAVTGNKQIIEEKAAPRGKKEARFKSFIFPPGTIDSLKPLLKDVYRVTGIERDESYWLNIDEDARFSPKEAWKKIKKANKDRGGISFETVAKAVLETDDQLNQAKGWRRISLQGVAALESSLAAKIIEEKNKPDGVK